MSEKQVEIIKQRLLNSIEVKKQILNDDEMISMIIQLVNEISSVIMNGGKVLICGNGGSASDALHMAGELVGRFKKERKAWPAIALNGDVASMTAIANDYGYDYIFERSVDAYMTPNDLLLGISTSGNSENVYKAILRAKELGGKTAALLGKDGGKIKLVTDYPIVVESNVTARVQESHITIIHIMCEMIENTLVEE